MTRGLILLSLVALISCRGEPETPDHPKSTPKASTTQITPNPTKTPAPGPGFFNKSKVMNGATDPSSELKAVTCAGTAADGSDDVPFHPRKVRGTVYAPFGQYASHVSPYRWWQNLLMGTAHAHPLPQEKPSKGVEVSLMLVAGNGKVARGPLLKTTTDDQGRYCFRIPDGISLSPALIAQTGQGPTRMRRNIVSRSTNNIFLQPEALIQILIASNIDLEQLPKSEFGNLYSMTDTIIDDRTHPRPLDLATGTKIEEGVALVHQRLLATTRFTDKLKVLKAAYSLNPAPAP